MKVQFKGVLLNLNFFEASKQNSNIGINIYSDLTPCLKENLTALLYQHEVSITIENYPNKTILGGNPKPIKVQEIGYAILQEDSLYHLRNSVLDFQEEGWSCIGASYWHDNLIYQTMVRRKD